MFEGFDMSKMSEMMGQMQEKAKEMQEQAKNIEFTAKAGGGLIEVTANGAGEVIDINIDDSLLDDKESLQILLISAMNDDLVTFMHFSCCCTIKTDISLVSFTRDDIGRKTFTIVYIYDIYLLSYTHIDSI